MKSKLRNVRPKARTEQLIVRELGPETLVYDLERERAHCLNPAATEIWRQCNGQHTLSELAEMDSNLFRSEPQDQRAELLRLALVELDRADLLDGKLEGLDPEKVLSRREAIQQFGGLAALPMVISLMQPSPATHSDFHNPGDP